MKTTKQSLFLILLLGGFSIPGQLFGQNVGIGTNAPSHKLTIISPDTNTVRLIGPTSIYGYNAKLHFGDGNLVFLKEFIDDGLNIHASSRTNITGGSVGINLLPATIPTHRLTIRSTNPDALRLIGPAADESTARLNFGDANNVYLEEDLDDVLSIYATGRTAIMGGNVGVGITTPSHRLTVTSTVTDDALRLIGPGTAGSGARLNFGDGDYVYLDEDADDQLTIYSSGRTAIMGGNLGIGTQLPSEKVEVYGPSANLMISNTAETSAGIAFQDFQTTTENASILFNSSTNLLGILHNGTARMVIGGNLTFSPIGTAFPMAMSEVIDITTGIPIPTSIPVFAPTQPGFGYLGVSTKPWGRIYATDHYSTNVFNLIFDTYDDLALLNAIEADTVWDVQLQHHVMRMDPNTMPAPIMERDTFADGSLGLPVMSYNRAIGLLMGSARQLDAQTKERDARIAARTEILADAMGVEFSQSGTVTRPIHDQGTHETSSTEIRVLFSDAFQSQLQPGQQPTIHITPRSWYLQYMVASVDENGFTLKVKMDPSESGFAFNWQANASTEVSLANSTSHLDDVFYKTPIEVVGEYPVLDRKAEEAALIEKAKRAYEADPSFSEFTSTDSESVDQPEKAPTQEPAWVMPPKQKNSEPAPQPYIKEIPRP